MTRDPSSVPAQTPGGWRNTSLGMKLGLAALAGAIAFFSWLLVAGVSRYRAMMADQPGALSASAWMPAGFEHDRSPEANAFRFSCSQCHVLPSPHIYTAQSWEPSLARMEVLIKEQGVSIPEPQWQMAREYVKTNARPARTPRPSPDPGQIQPSPAPSQGDRQGRGGHSERSAGQSGP